MFYCADIITMSKETPNSAWSEYLREENAVGPLTWQDIQETIKEYVNLYSTNEGYKAMWNRDEVGVIYDGIDNYKLGFKIIIKEVGQ